MIPIPALLLHPWVKKIGAALAILLLLLFIRHKLIQQGKEEGKQEASRELVKANEEDRQRERTIFLEKMAEADKAREEAQARYEAALQRESQMAATVRDLARRRQDAAEGVSRIPDAGLHGVIVKELGLRPAGDETPGYLAAEERELARCLVDRPLCQKQTEALAGQIEELRQQVAATQDKQKATDAKLDAFVTYTGQLEGHYTQLYNAFPRKRNWPLSILTLGIKGKPKRLPTPDPAELRGLRPR